MQGLASLTPAEVREWADLRGAMSNIDASRNLVLHRAQVTGGSEETTQEIVKIMGQTGIAASAGVVGNMKEFLTQPGFGTQIKNSTQKISQIYQGQSVYKADNNIGKVISYILMVNIKTIFRFLITKGNLRLS